LASGYWKSKADVLENWQVSRIFEPAMPQARREELLKGWEKAVKSALEWAR
jgi:glycerol kinase